MVCSMYNLTLSTVCILPYTYDFSFHNSYFHSLTSLIFHLVLSYYYIGYKTKLFFSQFNCESIGMYIYALTDPLLDQAIFHYKVYT